jgi:uncharacterized protein (TIGR00375 family)
VLNVKFYPEEGKYNRTACTRCYAQYSLQDAKKMHMRCPVCRGLIKKGVRDRVDELAAWPEPMHPAHRPPCIHTIPLSEIIVLALRQASPYNKSVQTAWEKIVDAFGSEVQALIDEPIEKIKKVADERVAYAIHCFRNGTIIKHPGGGGAYGRFELPDASDKNTRADDEMRPRRKGQTALLDF